MNKSHKLLWIFLGIIVLLMIGAISIYNFYSKISPQDVEQLQDIETTTSAVDTTGWKTYRNEKYGFEFRYPNEYTESVGVNQYGVDTIVFVDERDTGFNLRFKVAVDNDVNGGADPLTVLKYTPERIASGPREIRIGNTQAQQYKIIWSFESTSYLFNYAVVKHGNRVYTLSDDGTRSDEKIFNLILSTFKFIQ